MVQTIVISNKVITIVCATLDLPAISGILREDYNLAIYASTHVSCTLKTNSGKDGLKQNTMKHTANWKWMGSMTGSKSFADSNK